PERLAQRKHSFISRQQQATRTSLIATEVAPASTTTVLQEMRSSLPTAVLLLVSLQEALAGRHVSSLMREVPLVSQERPVRAVTTRSQPVLLKGQGHTTSAPI